VSFLPINARDMEKRGWDQCDLILVSGDAYVDHPSFGTALVGRYLESLGYKVGIIAQPQNREDYTLMGPPRLGWLVSSGNMDSMVNHYTANKKLRSEDSYSPGGQRGLRPDRALIPYCSTLRSLYKGIPVILGGVEASLRRLAHYDYWSDKIRRSILADSKADLLIYGMAERPLEEICRRLSEGESIKQMSAIPGTLRFLEQEESLPENSVTLPSYEEILESPKAFAHSFRIQSRENNPFSGNPLIQKYGNRNIIQYPPPEPLKSEELDKLYGLFFERKAHPSYKKMGGVPALKEVLFSITSNRGCFGGCSFCAITFHQGEIVHSRSHASILQEVENFKKDPRFKGIVHDLGGPTANFTHPSCAKQAVKGPCADRKCLFPDPCPNLDCSQQDYRNLLKKVRETPGVKKVFIRSGIRFDYLLQDQSEALFNDICQYHISGQLKVAPEHASPSVLKLMGKPGISNYKRFRRQFEKINRQLNKKQYLIPYLIASHPGTGLKEAVELAEFLRDSGFIPDQVQDFYPTPGTLSSVMYYSGIDPRNGNLVYVAKKGRERAMLRALLQYNRNENRTLVIEALTKAGRRDLIGYGPKCLVTPPVKKGRRKK